MHPLSPALSAMHRNAISCKGYTSRYAKSQCANHALPGTTCWSKCSMLFHFVIRDAK